MPHSRSTAIQSERAAARLDLARQLVPPPNSSNFSVNVGFAGLRGLAQSARTESALSGPIMRGSAEPVSCRKTCGYATFGRYANLTKRWGT
jgi:hypothetical protein